MRLIDIESPWQTHEEGAATPWSPGSARATSCSTWPPTLQATTFALHPVAKFLNALLEILFAAIAKILRAALCPSDAD